MNFKLIVSDLDGSLLNSRALIPQEVKKKIAFLSQKGIEFTFATGRMFDSTLEYIRDLRIHLPVITLNGCVVRGKEHDSVIHNSAISNETFQNIWDWTAELNSTKVVITEEKTYLKNSEEVVKSALQSWMSNILPYKELDDSSKITPNELMFIDTRDALADKYDFLKKKLGDKLKFFFFPSEKYEPLWYLEIRARDSSKGRGLLKLLDYLGLRSDDVLTIGDFYNDLSMFEVAEHSAALCNAPAEVKEKANYVSRFSNDEKGVMDIFEYYEDI